MNTKAVDFFATRTDLESGFRAIEKQQPVKLVRIDDYQTKTIPVIGSMVLIPDLGKVADRRSHDFLVVPASKKPRPYRVVQVGRKRDFPAKIAIALAIMKIRPPGGKVLYHVYQSNNPCSIVFAPGGFLNQKTLIAGRISTIHDNRTSLALYKLFCSELLRGFSSVQSFEVGPEALAFLKSGGRLTIDAQAAPILDLVLA